MVLTTLFGGARETRELTPGTYMIGRAESCRVRFDAPEVSERHAILTVRDGKAILEDLHSANGTLVNGEAIDAAVILDSGMVVTVGTAMMRVSEEERDQGSGIRDQAHSAASFLATRPPTILGSALPFESFMTCPTKNPAAAFLPALKSATGPGFAAIA